MSAKTTKNIAAAIALLLTIGALWYELFGVSGDQLQFENSVKIGLSLIVGYFVFHSIVDYYERNQLIENTTRVLEDLKNAAGFLRIIKHSQQYYRELRAAMESAEDSILLFYLTQDPPEQMGRFATQYWEWFEKFAKRKNNLVIKRIATITNKEKASWVLEHAERLGDVRGYGLRCFNPEETLSLLGLELIDKKEIFIFGPHGKTPRWLYVDNEDISGGMAAYFDQIWDKVGHIGVELKAVGMIGIEESRREDFKRQFLG